MKSDQEGICTISARLCSCRSDSPASLMLLLLAAITQVDDATLRQRNPEFGYRDTREVAAAADEVGLALSSTTRMPANNLLLEFVRS